MMQNKLVAKLFSGKEPSEKRKAEFIDFLKTKIGKDFSLEWVKTDKYGSGFRLEADDIIYDWSVEGKLNQLRSTLKSIDIESPDYTTLVKKAVEDWHPIARSEKCGKVLSLADGVARVSGLYGVSYGEILQFDGGEKGLVQDIDGDKISCILFEDDNITSGTRVYKTGRSAAVKVSDEIIGRVVDSLGNPVDGKGDYNGEKFMPIESPAPRIIDRSPVDSPLKTGILTIDSMFPIGKGQRELIIGDRQTGKTSIATDTIINQKGKDVLCVYVAIGQKASTVKRVVSVLEEKGAMAYTTVVFSSASDSAPLQYLAPYSGTAIAEYFMNKGRDVLIVYDDLSKHAVAYRTISLLLGRSPGREAYPGDIFYLHSRLLERSAHLSAEKGGGSITALPIVETQAGDVSAYIPTNIISITDGQIFLESSLFYSGQRPAINVGLSVSRVGGSAQTKGMKKAVGTLRLELAQYREMKTFTQFSSDLDDSIKEQLIFGKALADILVQPVDSPYEEWQEIIILLVSLNKTTMGMSSAEIRPFFIEFCDKFNKSHPQIVERLNMGELTEDDAKTVKDEATSFLREYKK